ncbi:hypothetical protein RB195_005311 [Necator americanus]|uniref:Uncharacterized protein n=1 Tax=Necator americanus TaxID=51031 RepID=A0ABR1BM72_NECAM
MVTGWWSAVGLIQCKFLNPGETTTPKKSIQQLMRRKASRKKKRKKKKKRKEKKEKERSKTSKRAKSATPTAGITEKVHETSDRTSHNQRFKSCTIKSCHNLQIHFTCRQPTNTSPCILTILYKGNSPTTTFPGAG